ncbi:MAG: transporter substrate-binding domain-containing protein [Bacteroidales bacterium]|nr:transporter substrate-binding domain-containing protein [Bacteroidales bacterium]
MTISVNHKAAILLLFVSLPLILGSCFRRDESRFRDVDQLKPDQVTHLEMIRERGVLRVVTEYNSISYFIYRGQPMGFQYEMLQELANYLDLALEVSVSNDLERNFSDLKEGNMDMIAMNLTVTLERKSEVSFTAPLLQTRQVLVQRKPLQWEKMNRVQMESSLIRNQLDLAGKVVYVQAGSVYEARLRSLSNEIGGGIEVREVHLEAEQLVQRVALGEIDYTVCDENVGLVNTTYFPQLDVSTAISFPQHVAWAVHQHSDSLRRVIDQWISGHQKTRHYAILYNKYFQNRHAYRNIHSEDYTLGSGKISRFDDVIKKEAERIGWDWRLMASVIYQESRFNPEAVSWAGAFGLMQLMPGTAENYGITMESSPEAQIRAGASFIKWLDDRFIDDIEDEEERNKFVLASYNIGLGHIQDARRLAERYEADPNVWHGSVDEWLLKKSDPTYYTDQVVKYGYARGIETYNFVKEILNRYEHYKNIMNNEVFASWRPIEEIHSISLQ